MFARLGMGMTPLALLFLVHQETGQYALAAVTSGAYALSAALASPVVGRLVDRLGAPPVLSVAAVANPLALGGLLVAAHARALGLIPVAAACAGMTYPPLTAAIRSAWIGLTEGERSGLRQSALAVETSLYELVFVTGPLLAPGFVPVLVCVASLSVSFGAVSVTVAAFASQHAGSGGQSLAGILLAVWGLGSVIGGFGYGALRIAAPLSRQFGWLLAAVAVSTALLAVMPGPLALGAALAIGGITIAPALTVYTAIVGRIVPAGMRNEANTWLATVPFAGNSAGGAMAGLIVDHPGTVPWSFGFAATVVAAAVLVAAWPSGPIKRADSAAVVAGELRAAALPRGDHQ